MLSCRFGGAREQGRISAWTALQRRHASDDEGLRFGGRLLRRPRERRMGRLDIGASGHKGQEQRPLPRAAGNRQGSLKLQAFNSAGEAEDSFRNRNDLLRRHPLDGRLEEGEKAGRRNSSGGSGRNTAPLGNSRLRDGVRLVNNAPLVLRIQPEGGVRLRRILRKAGWRTIRNHPRRLLRPPRHPRRSAPLRGGEFRAPLRGQLHQVHGALGHELPLSAQVDRLGPESEGGGETGLREGRPSRRNQEAGKGRQD